MIKSNTVILSLDGARLLPFFVNDTRFSDVFCTENAHSAMSYLQNTRADILVLERTLPGCDGRRFLLDLEKKCASGFAPRVLHLQRFWNETLEMCDRTVPIDRNPESIADEAAALWQVPVPALCRATFGNRLQIAGNILKEMNAPEKFAGFLSLVYGSAFLSCSDRNDLPMQEWLYPHVAHYVKSSAYCVERNLRTIVEYTWLKGNLQAIQFYFGNAYDAEKGKPTNACVLCTLAQHIRTALSIQSF